MYAGQADSQEGNEVAKKIDTPAADDAEKARPEAAPEDPNRSTLATIAARRRAEINEMLANQGDDPLPERADDAAAMAKASPATKPEDDDQDDEDADKAEGQAAAEPPAKTAEPPSPGPAKTGDGTGDEPPAQPTPATRNLVRVRMEDGTEVMVPPANIRVRTVVEGEERDIDGEELRQGFQMEAVARKRLRTATQRELAAEAREREIAAREAEHASAGKTQAGDSKTADGAGKPQAVSDDEYKAKRLALMERIQVGSEAEAAEAMDELLDLKMQKLGIGAGGAGSQAQSIDPAQVAAAAARQVMQTQAYRGTLEAFVSEYPVIAEQSERGQAVAREAAFQAHRMRAQDLTELGYDLSRLDLNDDSHRRWLAQTHAKEQTTGAVRSELDLYRAAGRSAYDTFGLVRDSDPAKQPAAGNGTQPKKPGQDKPNARVDAKRGGGSPPRPATAFDSSPPAKQPKTRSQVVQNMAKQRGQAVA